MAGRRQLFISVRNKSSLFFFLFRFSKMIKKEKFFRGNQSESQSKEDKTLLFVKCGKYAAFVVLRPGRAAAVVPQPERFSSTLLRRSASPTLFPPRFFKLKRKSKGSRQISLSRVNIKMARKGERGASGRRRSHAGNQSGWGARGKKRGASP